MASMRDIKRRKGSIQSTQQITKAMKLVSTVKLQKAKINAENSKSYFDYMYDTVKGMVRGKHAHKSLEQILVCIHGSCKVQLDNGIEKKIVALERPYEGLYISNDIWREMFDFSPEAVLMVLASDYYKEEDYIRDYEEFLMLVQSKEKK